MTMMTTDQWMALLKEVGLTDEDLHRWHVLFEKNHPEQHQSFLEWLGLDTDRIASIRKSSK